MTDRTVRASDLDRDVYALSHLMDFEHVIRVDDQGVASDSDIPSGIYAPEVYDDEDNGPPSVSEGWSLLNGYSGQDRYSGPVMHPSEFIGGGMARDILSEPGYYVAVVVCCAPHDQEDDPCDISGWAVARKDDDK